MGWQTTTMLPCSRHVIRPPSTHLPRCASALPTASSPCHRPPNVSWMHHPTHPHYSPRHDLTHHLLAPPLVEGCGHSRHLLRHRLYKPAPRTTTTRGGTSMTARRRRLPKTWASGKAANTTKARTGGESPTPTTLPTSTLTTSTPNTDVDRAVCTPHTTSLDSFPSM